MISNLPVGKFTLIELALGLNRIGNDTNRFYLPFSDSPMDENHLFSKGIMRSFYSVKIYLNLYNTADFFQAVILPGFTKP